VGGENGTTVCPSGGDGSLSFVLFFLFILKQTAGRNLEAGEEDL